MTNLVTNVRGMIMDAQQKITDVVSNVSLEINYGSNNEISEDFKNRRARIEREMMEMEEELILSRKVKEEENIEKVEVEINEVTNDSDEIIEVEILDTDSKVISLNENDIILEEETYSDEEEETTDLVICEKEEEVTVIKCDNGVEIECVIIRDEDEDDLEEVVMEIEVEKDVETEEDKQNVKNELYKDEMKFLNVVKSIPEGLSPVEGLQFLINEGVNEEIIAQYIECIDSSDIQKANHQQKKDKKNRNNTGGKKKQKAKNNK